MKPAGDLDALSMAGRCSTGILWRFVGLMGYLCEAPSGESLVGPEVDQPYCLEFGRFQSVARSGQMSLAQGLPWVRRK
jgi:hypothetical protein